MHPTADQIIEREEARLGHLRYCEQQFDGCSPEAMQTLSIMHDLLNAGSHHLEMEKAIVEAQSVWPLSAAGVWPNGTPAHWLAVAS